MILAVTGHRPDKLGGYRIPNPVYNEVIQKIDLALMTLRPDMVITGMALGVDQWTAEVCLRNGLPYTAAIPFEGFSDMWPTDSQEYYRYLIRHAYHTHLCFPARAYSPDLLHLRNEWMVDNSDALLSVCRPDLVGARTGGTSGTIEYATRRRKPIHRVDLTPQSITFALNEEIAIEQRRSARQNQQSPGLVGRPAPVNQAVIQQGESLMRSLAIQGATTRANTLPRTNMRSPPPQAKNGEVKEKSESSGPGYRRVIDID